MRTVAVNLFVLGGGGGERAASSLCCSIVVQIDQFIVDLVLECT